MFKKLIQIFIVGLLTLPMLALAAGTVRLPATGQIRCFDDGGGVIPCTGSGQDGDTLANGVAWPAPRFTDNLNGTVTDNLTALVWTKHANAPELALGLAFCTQPPSVTPGPENDMTWPQSFDYVNCLNNIVYLGSNDWRLPNVNELESMVNAEVLDTSVYLNANGFGLVTPNSQVQTSQYWTSTTDASSIPGTTIATTLATPNAWDMDLSKGQSLSSLKTAALGTKAVWPVRGVSTGPAKIWRTGQDACFDLAGTPIPCAGTGQDGEKLAGAAWPAARFKANLDNTFVLDRVTGLIWTNDTNTPGPLGGLCAGTGLPAGLSWLNALSHATCLNNNSFLGLQPNPVIGNTGWRIPNRKELRSLVDYSRGGAALPAAHPFTGIAPLPPLTLRWSSTTDVSVPSQAWTVDLLNGTLGSNGKAGTRPAWPVSGPDLVAPALTLAQGNLTTNIVAQTISGTVEAGATVTVANNGGAPVAAVVIGTDWNFTPTLAAGLNNLTVTAADFSENLTSAPITITFIIPDGLISTGVGPVLISDALKALRISVNLVVQTADDLLRGDVAPLGAPDGLIKIDDALLILRKAVGLPSF